MAQATTTLYAAEGAPILTLPRVDGRYQTATMLFSDIERKRFEMTFREPLAEGEVRTAGYPEITFSVTWATAQDQRAAA